MTEEEQQLPKDPRTMPVYTISTASRLTRIPAHTIRWLETHRCVCPSRTSGNQRLFSEIDIDLLRELAALLQRGVNAAGMRTIIEIKQTYRISTIKLEISADEAAKEEN